MKNMLLIFALSVAGLGSIAQAEIAHPGSCSEFEQRNGCIEYYSRQTQDTACSCPGEPMPASLAFAGTQCSQSGSPMAPYQRCCRYVKGSGRVCWVQD